MRDALHLFISLFFVFMTSLRCAKMLYSTGTKNRYSRIQNKSGLEERIITQDSDIFWTTYTLDLSSEGEGENQFPEGTEYVKFNIVAISEGPIWFDNAIFANEKTFIYNAANEITNTGFSYDDNGGYLILHVVDILSQIFGSCS